MGHGGLIVHYFLLVLFKKRFTNITLSDSELPCQLVIDSAHCSSSSSDGSGSCSSSLAIDFNRT